jgi:hypothetical protein
MSLFLICVKAASNDNSWGGFVCLAWRYQTKTSALEMIINHKRTCFALELKILPPDQPHQTLIDGFDESCRHGVVLNA